MNEAVSTSQAPELWLSLLTSAGMLCIVIAVLLGVLYLIKRLSAVGGISGDGDGIQVISSRYLADKSRLMVVDVAGEKMLLGVTPHNINLISKLSYEDGFFSEKKTANAGFKEMLGKVLGGKSVVNNTGDENER